MQAALVEFVGQAVLQTLKEKGLVAVAMAVIALPTVMASPPSPPPSPEEDEALAVTVTSPFGSLFGLPIQGREADFQMAGVVSNSHFYYGDDDEDGNDESWKGPRD